MWRWPWIPIFAASLAAALAIPNAGAPARADDAKGLPSTSSGPVSPQEASILWQDGKAAFDAGKFEDACDRLQRLVDRYPGYPGYLEAHLLLGRARIELKQDEKALAPLRYAVDAAGRTALGAEAHLWLARAELGLRKFNEAYLTAVEAEKIRVKQRPELQPTALILRAQALIGLGHDSRAARALDSADQALAKAPAAPAIAALRGEADWTRLRLQDRACARFPSKGPLKEDQARDQMSRRGTCLLESMLIYRRTLDAGDARAATRASDEITDAFRSYARACTQPPAPPRLKPKDRTVLQLKRYREELATMLEQDCSAKLGQATDLARSWRSQVAPGMSGYVTALADNVEKLRKTEK